MMDPTWDKLIEIEPRLEELLEIVRAVEDDESLPHFCAREAWNDRSEGPSLRDKTLKLVGWQAERDNLIIRSSEAFELMSRKIREELPECRQCRCSRGYKFNPWHV
jgi:hypothetical protein